MKKTILSKKGYTVTELMVVMMIIGILATVASLKISTLAQRSKETKTVQNLASIRSALDSYYIDHDGRRPTDLSELTLNGRYLSNIPETSIPTQEGSVLNNVTNVVLGDGQPDACPGGYLYHADGTDPDFGKVTVNCNLPDSRGILWTSY